MQRNLKRLVVDPLGSLPVGWNLLPHFPNLQNVQVTPHHLDTFFAFNNFVAPHLTEISEQLNTMPRTCRITVEDLRFWLRGPEDVSFSKTILQIPQLFLPKLDCIVEFNDSEDCEMDVISTAILQHGENLEHLHVNSLRRQLPYDHFPFTPGPFNATTSIDLRGNLCENLHFLQHFPNLKTLQMCNFGEELLERTDSTIMETFTLPSLKGLLLEMDCDITEDKMEILVKAMPKVEKFRGRLINTSLRVLCREWKQLKDLFIVTSLQFHLRINDEGITGIVSGREERLPNITELKDLSNLSLNKVNGLSDASIWQGFLEMPSVKNLNVQISEYASENAFLALIRKFPDSKITRRSRSSNDNCSESEAFSCNL